MISHPDQHRNGDQPHPESNSQRPREAPACHDLTLAEAALLARVRTDALHRVHQAEPKLTRLGERLMSAALAVTDPPPPAEPAPAWERAADLVVEILRTRVRATVVIALCAAVALVAYRGDLAQSASTAELSLPAGCLVLAFLLLVGWPAQAYARRCAARSCTHTAPASARHEQTSPQQAPLAAREAHHRAWLALEAEVNRLLVAYHCGIAGAEARILQRRAAHGPAHPCSALQVSPAAVPPSPVGVSGPTLWLDAPTPPGVQAVLEPSLRLLAHYQPPDLRAG